MDNRNTDAEVIIIGGSYAGLSAAMSLGRALRKVIVFDHGKPCNRFTPHSHNFITQDGVAPVRIAAVAREQALYYPTVKLVDSYVAKVGKEDGRFLVEVEGESFSTEKLLLATGMKDVLPEIEGFADCWGKSILHCPYCHGYEVRKQETGILGNGDAAFQMAMLISNWTDRLTIFTNDPAAFTREQLNKLGWHNIPIVEDAVTSIRYEHGYLKSIKVRSGEVYRLSVIYTRPVLQQHGNLHELLGCALTETGHISTDEYKRTTVDGVYAAGDNATMMRSVSVAVAAGTLAGAFINHDLIAESF